MAKKQTRPSVDDYDSPELSPVDSADEIESSDEDPVDSEDGLSAGDDEFDDDDDEDDEDDDDDEEFEDQGASDDESELLEAQEREEDSDEDVALRYENEPRSWGHSVMAAAKRKAMTAETALWMNTDDLSSDDEDEDGTGNRIGRVPLHWYDEYDHIGYDSHGKKVGKSAGDEAGDRLDQAIAMHDNKAQGKYIVQDMLNNRNVELTPRQLELIRRVQAGAFAHPEHDGNPDYIDYFSGVNQEVMGLSHIQYEPKARYQPSKWEKLQVDKLLKKLEEGEITMDDLKGKTKDKKKEDENKLYMMWKGDEEDEIAMRKGPQHMAAPKVPPPGHAESYIPPDEYLPTEEEKKQWQEMEPKERPHGLVVPKKHPNLRSVGAYEHSVRETFERCLDLYLCPRVMKRRLNIDPESLVPQLPKARDLKPYPNAKCIEYITPYESDSEPPIIRCVSPSPDGQFMVSGASDGFVRLWEVESSRLLQSWDLSKIANSMVMENEDQTTEEKPTRVVVQVAWNPNRAHHCILAAVGRCVVILAPGTASMEDAQVTELLLASAVGGGNVRTPQVQKHVQWRKLPEDDKSQIGQSVLGSKGRIGPVCVLVFNGDVSSIRWQAKGDYFVTVAPKAGPASVLIHQLSKGNSQQPFSKAKGEIQTACFHPNKPFLLVANQQHVRIYHLVKQALVKRLVSGCRWISSLDVHPSGDHVIVGSLDRRLAWFDLDLSASPYKKLKYHERAVRASCFHRRYPLLASASDDGTVHIFHSMVYSDLMRNPLIVPVKILRGHTVKNRFGVLAAAFHPTQPWIFTGGADGKIILFQDI